MEGKALGVIIMGVLIALAIWNMLLGNLLSGLFKPAN